MTRPQRIYLLSKSQLDHLCVFFLIRAPSTWNEQTLKDLDMLPLYLTSTFYENFDKVSERLDRRRFPLLVFSDFTSFLMHLWF